MIYSILSFSHYSFQLRLASSFSNTTDVQWFMRISAHWHTMKPWSFEYALALLCATWRRSFSFCCDPHRRLLCMCAMYGVYVCVYGYRRHWEQCARCENESGNRQTYDLSSVLFCTACYRRCSRRLSDLWIIFLFLVFERMFAFQRVDVIIAETTK